MMKYLSFVKPLLDLGQSALVTSGKLVSDLANKAESNPKTALVAAAGAWFGFNPDHVVLAASYIARFAGFVAAIGKAMGG